MTAVQRHARSARPNLRRHHRRRRPSRPGARLAICRNAASTSCWWTAGCNTAARWSPRRSTAPGFYHNLHSINHFHISETPWFKDLGLADRVDYITPRYEFGQPHLDGSALIFGRDLEETLANVARFSKKDAQTFRDWNRKAEEITAKIFLPERFSDPLPQAEREALLSKSEIGRDFLAMTRRQPFDVVKELFENEHVQLLFLFKVSLFGTWLVDTLSKTSPMGSVIRAFDLQSGYQLCQGGSGNLARALFETFIAAGGRYRAAGRARPDRHRGRQGDRHRAEGWPHGAGQAVRRLDAQRAPDLRGLHRPRRSFRRRS